MRDRPLYDLIERLWTRLTGKEFVPLEFAKLILRHGGHDMKKLREEDVLRLLGGTFTGNWHEPAFAFSELLAFYSVPDANRAKEEIVGWVFASFVIADAIQRGATDLEMQFNLFLNGFLEVRNELDIYEAIDIFQRVFHRDGVSEQRST